MTDAATPTATSGAPIADDRTTAPPGVPPGRDVVIDMVRAVCIAAVAVGHWLVIVPTYADGRFDGTNALADVPLMQALSWLFQVMPLFFLAGGVANAASWRSARRRGDGYGTWLAGRLRRLLAPTTVFLALGVAAAVVARALGADPDQVAAVAWLVVVPLWFLSVYVVVVALAPAMLRLHEAAGIAVLAALAVLAVATDSLRLAGAPGWVAAGNFAWIFLACQQLGFFWLGGQVERRRRWLAPLSVAGGLGALALLTGPGPYPVSMVGVPGEAVQNNAPPTVTFLALVAVQLGVLAAAAPALRRLLGRRRRLWSSVVAVNLHALTLHLWHLTALAVVALVVLPRWDVPAGGAPGSGGWWAVRVAWLVPMAAVLVGLTAAVGRHERRALTGARRWPPSSGPAALTATLLLAVAFAIVTTGGLSRPGLPWGLPVPALVAYALALGALAWRPAGVRGRPGPA